MAANQTRPQKDVFVKVNFPDTAREAKFFNVYDLRRHGGFVFMRLAYIGPDGQGLVFSGAIYASDALHLIPSFKEYVPKLGDPLKNLEVPQFPPIHHPSPTPVSFHHLGAIYQEEMGELSVGQFSHRKVFDSSSKAGKGAELPAIVGVSLGVYTSPADIHQRLIMDFIKAIETK